MPDSPASGTPRRSLEGAMHKEDRSELGRSAMARARRASAAQDDVLVEMELTSGPPLSGTLKKMSRRGIWQSRHFEMRNQYLHYYKHTNAGDNMGAEAGTSWTSTV